MISYNNKMVKKIQTVTFVEEKPLNNSDALLSRKINCQKLAVNSTILFSTQLKSHNVNDATYNQNLRIKSCLLQRVSIKLP
jgi:hypothetical protein